MASRRGEASSSLFRSIADVASRRGPPKSVLGELVVELHQQQYCTVQSMQVSTKSIAVLRNGLENLSSRYSSTGAVTNTK